MKYSKIYIRFTWIFLERKKDENENPLESVYSTNVRIKIQDQVGKFKEYEESQQG